MIRNYSLPVYKNIHPPNIIGRLRTRDLNLFLIWRRIFNLIWGFRLTAKKREKLELSSAKLRVWVEFGDHGIPSLFLISMFLLSYIGSLFLTLSFLSNGRHQQVTHSVIGKFYHIYSTRFYLPQNIFSTPWNVIAPLGHQVDGKLVKGNNYGIFKTVLVQHLACLEYFQIKNTGILFRNSHCKSLERKKGNT